MIQKRWINGTEATEQEWQAVDLILEARGWMALNRETSCILLAEENGQIVGLMVVQLVPSAGPLYVDPQHSGSGLAEELSDDMLRWLVDNQARGWLVIADNPYTSRLCEARGMKRITRPVYTTEQ